MYSFDFQEKYDDLIFDSAKYHQSLVLQKNCVKMIWGNKILQLEFNEMGVKERVLATQQPTGGRDWLAKTSPSKHSNLPIVGP